MTEEQRAKKREYSKKYRKEHPLSEEKKAEKRRKAKEYYAQKKRHASTGVARHPSADAKRKREKKETPDDTISRKNEQARALGISYGKYQMLKQQGRLPEHISITEKPKTEKLGVYIPPERGLGEFNAVRERMFAVATAKILEEKRMKRILIANGDRQANEYMERMKRQKEVMERAGIRTDQNNC